MKDKNFIIIFLLLFTISFLIANMRAYEKVEESKAEEIDVTGDIHKANWEEALLEFGDEDDTLDSLEYVPEFIK